VIFKGVIQASMSTLNMQCFFRTISCHFFSDQASQAFFYWSIPSRFLWESRREAMYLQAACLHWRTKKIEPKYLGNDLSLNSTVTIFPHPSFYRSPFTIKISWQQKMKLSTDRSRDDSNNNY